MLSCCPGREKVKKPCAFSSRQQKGQVVVMGREGTKMVEFSPQKKSSARKIHWSRKAEALAKILSAESAGSAVNLADGIMMSRDNATLFKRL